MSVGLAPTSEDGTSATGWEIGDRGREFRRPQFNRCFTTDRRGNLQIYASTARWEPPPPPPRATPTLSALALENASDDSAITISPVFASGTTSYTASVLNGVDEITIEPTVNESNAMVEYLDSSDTAIADANSGLTGQQVSLERARTRSR